ncbi:hypothetical protein [Paenibacillus kobensis]|uniref:hypothetical protein n=1 Tax=Paenibacillus kobensis TaxID=59841 RepID=UPI000FD801B2|nr:hypothetical protein [Paenibacillus kobensis]
MTQTGIPNAKPEMMKLAAMECAASCIMTHLYRSGADPGLFLLDYWNVNYVSRIITASQHVRLNKSLPFLYGIHLVYKGTGPDLLKHSVQSGNRAVVKCRPADLDFFPPNMLSMAESGFDHYILADSFDEARNAFRVFDPIVDFDGFITEEELLRASAEPEEEEILYYELQPDQDQKLFESPDKRDIFAYASKRNYEMYVRSQYSSGTAALDSFAHDLQGSLALSPEQTSNWLSQNSIAIASITKLRSSIWNSFVQLGVMDKGQVLEGTNRISGILKQWTTLNFLLVKYRKNIGTESLLSSALARLREVQDAELQFLVWMNGIGGDLIEV